MVSAAPLGRKAEGDDVLARYVDIFNSKYSWSFDAANPMVTDGTVEVLPSVVLAWNTVAVRESTPEMSFPNSAGRWRLG